MRFCFEKLLHKTSGQVLLFEANGLEDSPKKPIECIEGSMMTRAEYCEMLLSIIEKIVQY